MLACVVGIPLVALSGTSWPAMLKKLQDYHWPAILGLANASTTTPATTLGDAPRFEPHMAIQPPPGQRNPRHATRTATAT